MHYLRFALDTLIVLAYLLTYSDLLNYSDIKALLHCIVIDIVWMTELVSGKLL